VATPDFSLYDIGNHYSSLDRNILHKFNANLQKMKMKGKCRDHLWPEASIFTNAYIEMCLVKAKKAKEHEWKRKGNDSRSGGLIMILNSKQVQRERRYKTTPVSDHQLRHSGLRQCNAELNQQSRMLDAKQISSWRRGTTSMQQRLYLCSRLFRVRWWCESTG